MNVGPGNGGTVKINGSVAASYPAVFDIDLYATVTLEAIPALGYTFSNWSGNLPGTANPASLYVDCDKTVTATFTPLPLALYFPHVASQAGNSPDIWETEICLINTGDRALTGMLRSYRNNGQAASPGKTIILAPHGRWSRIVGGGEFTNPSEIRYMVFESPFDSVVGYTKFYQEGVYRTAIPAVKEVNASNIYIPHIAANADWWTGVSLVNTTPVPKVLTITFNNDQIRQISLAANQHMAFNIAEEFFDNQPPPDIESAVITNASGVIGLELFGSVAWGTQLEGILLTDKTTSTIYYPHVAGNEWWTGIVAYNASGSAGTIIVTSYKPDGTFLSSQDLPIAGKGKYVGTVAELGLPDQAAWFKITSTSKLGPTSTLTGFELFGVVDGSQLGAYAGNGAVGSKTGVFAKIEKDGWTGIAFVNTEANAASVTLTAYNDNGTPVATQALSSCRRPCQGGQ